jgi:hypothetical protein
VEEFRADAVVEADATCFTVRTGRGRGSPPHIPSANLLTASETSRNSFGAHDLKEGKMVDESPCWSVIAAAQLQGARPSRLCCAVLGELHRPQRPPFGLHAAWDGNKWVQVSNWIEPMKDKVMPLLDAAAADYVSKNQPWPKRTEACDKSS